MTRGPWAGPRINPNELPSLRSVSGSASPVRLKTLNMSARNWSDIRSVRCVFFTIPKSSLLWPGPRVRGKNPGEFPKREINELTGDKGETGGGATAAGGE